MLLETICFEFGKYPLLKWHQDRLNKSFLQLFHPSATPHRLEDLLPLLHGDQKRKIRFIYDQSTYSIEVQDYFDRTINQVQCVYHNEVTYEHKFQNREVLDHLYDQKGDADEILIIKNNLVTDSYYYNPIFWDGSHWYAPISYLLAGTRRQFLIDTGRVKERNISVSDINSFEKMSLINALVDLGSSEIVFEKIRF